MLLRCRRYLTQLSTHLYTLLVPVGIRWEASQRRYVKWAKTPMLNSYIEYVKIMGEEFSAFIGQPTRMIDIGCGNGVFNGMSYAEVGYIPIKRMGSYILGVDPLPLENPIPWLSEFKQGKIEDLELHGFTQAAFVTTFDHIEDIDKALTRLREAGVTQIFIWETLYRRHTRGDRDHSHHYTFTELADLLGRHGFRLARVRKVDDLRDTEGYFLEAKIS